ncbi:telomere repeat binding factor-domain-containing protein [Thelonectria olida]|uniref:Telomere repeat binding factor-domain-containing protein n=1 Tax=Thelonectria olida TaxID=1576542 RepID=A0A9P8W2J8_9HYPO|nr:telomere repeat binding factor-domain-containing protein [Thelonectria olida]
MAEPAQPELSAAMSPPGIKQEQNLLDGLDLELALQAATKRPFPSATETDNSSKRVKSENDAVANHNTFENNESTEQSLEDGLALLVQNALSNVGDLMDQFNQNGDETHATVGDPMDVDTAPIPEEPHPLPLFDFQSDPQKYLRTASRNALGNLAISVLLVFSQPFDDAIKPIKDNATQHAQSFLRLQKAFEQVKLIYSEKSILSSVELDLQDDESRTILGLANLAQFGLWLLDASLGSYQEANQNFHAIFPDQISNLPSEAKDLLLALKTQIAIESVQTKTADQQADQLLNGALVDGLEDNLRSLHDGVELTPEDQEFVTSARSRRDALQNEAQAEDATLKQKYPADDLIRNFSTCAKSRVSSISELGTRLGLTMPLHADPVLDILPDGPVEPDLDLDDLSSFFEKTTSGLVQNALAGLAEEEPAQTPAIEVVDHSTEASKTPAKSEPTPTQTTAKVDLMTDYKELEALVAESTSNYVKTTLHGLSPVPYQPTVPTSTAENMTAQAYLNQLHAHTQQNPYYSYTQTVPEPQPPAPAPGENLPPNQTCPSSMLYDKARQAALTKNTSHTRREGIHSTRRPWTQEEEKALMAGLDMVKGPHWSQILTLFGHNGSISDILKERTQVQLKDKARNLKLFFLKTNSEMPFYLQAVTGELKTRAPTQAARKEAEERARMNSEEEQARIQGIMTLAGGLHNPPQARAAGGAATAIGTGVVTPAQAAATQAASTQQMAHGTAHAHAPATHSGYPPSSLPQARTAMMATSHQALQSVPQGSPRPQTSRPQTQHSQQSQVTYPSPVLAHTTPQVRSQTSTPIAQNHYSSPHISPTPQPTPSVAAQSVQPQQSHYSPPTSQAAYQTPTATMQAPTAQMHSQSPTPGSLADMHDNAAEVALLQGLQAAVAEIL